MSSSAKGFIALVVAALAVGLFAKPPRAISQSHLPPMLPRKELLGFLGAGHRELIADYFWVQTLQAVTRAQTAEEYRDIYDYAILVAGLDPHFRPIYVFAGAALPLEFPRGVYANTQESTELLQLGRLRFPDYAYVSILYAYNLAEFHREYVKAAEVLSSTAEMPGTPRYLSALATRLYAQAGAFDTGLMLAQSLAEGATDPNTKETFERRVAELQLERELKRVDMAAQTFKDREGRWPASIVELIRVGLLDRPPEDPFGGNIYLDEDGRARSSAVEKRLDLHRDFE